MADDKQRPTVWIVLTVVFACAAIALGIVALNAGSDADEVAAEPVSQEEVATEEPTPEPEPVETDTPEPAETGTPEPAATETPEPPAPEIVIDPETQERYEAARAELGQASEDLDRLQQELDAALAQAAEADQARQDAAGAIERAKAEAAAVKADMQVTKACLRGTIAALDEAFTTGGAEAAIELLESLAGSCKAEAEPGEG